MVRDDGKRLRQEMMVRDCGKEATARDYRQTL